MPPALFHATSPSHVAVFMYGGDAAGSGAQARVLTLADAMAARGHRVDVVVVQAGAPLRAALTPRLRLIELGAWVAHPATVTHWSRAALYGSVPALARYLRRARPAVLLAAATHINLAALWASRLAGRRVPVVLRESNTPPARRLNCALIRRCYPWAAAIIAVSHGVAGSVAATTGMAPDRITTIYNAVVTPELLQRITAPLEHAWFHAAAPPVILGVGRLMPQKDFPTLLRAFARVRATRPARLVVLGHGDATPLQALAGGLGIADDVAFPGFVSNPLPYMKRAAVFVLSSAWEGLPGVLIEALACGTAVVSTDCPSGPAEILDGGAYGRLVAVGDDAALAEAIQSTLEHPPHRQWLRDRAALFSLETAVEQYLAVLERVHVP